MFAARKCFMLVCVYLLHNWRKYLACHGPGIKCFLLQVGTDGKRLRAYLLHSAAISLVSEYHLHLSARHLAIEQAVV